MINADTSLFECKLYYNMYRDCGMDNNGGVHSIKGCAVSGMFFISKMMVICVIIFFRKKKP